jgi:nuclear cap-binding protein subunit 1
MASFISVAFIITILLCGLGFYTFLQYSPVCADDNDNHYRGGDDRRGPQRRRNDDGPRRGRYEEPPFPKLRRLLLNIASSTKLPQDEAIEIAKFFGEHFDDERLRSDFFDVLVQL